MNKLKTPLVTFLTALALVASPFIGNATNDVNSAISSPVSNDAYSYVKKYMSGFKNGNFVIGNTTPDGVKSIIGDYYTETESLITVGKTFAGFTFDAEWVFEDGLLASFTCYTFYDSDRHSEAEKDGDETFALMKNLFGEPIVITEDFYDWEINDMLVSCDLFEDGYSIYADPLSGMDEELDLSCVGDFASLKYELGSMVTGIKNGNLSIGASRDQVKSITGDAEIFDREYDGLWAAGDFIYEGEAMLSFDIDYFYDCTSALILLDIDFAELTDYINEIMGFDGKKSEYSEDTTMIWIYNNQELRLVMYDDGYGLYFSNY
jgi:hypothetical protein